MEVLFYFHFLLSEGSTTGSGWVVIFGSCGLCAGGGTAPLLVYFGVMCSLGGFGFGPLPLTELISFSGFQVFLG